ncbi:MAG: ATP-binding protein [Flavobacteriales bacterium]|nr:ATP-binding protein [Flavobacteriales bacterium]
MARKFPVIAITGPRQSGKTTLAKKLFADLAYTTLENPDTKEFATNDPKGFLNQFSDGVIIDEVQNVPQLFSYIQGIVDESGELGKFVLTGSQNFLLMEKVTQSLAGRVYIYNLLPFSFSELSDADKNHELNVLMHTGGYPRIYQQQIEPSDFFPSYVQSYVERDVRLLVNVSDLQLFSAFLKLCAARVGQLFNASALANELGVSYKTVQRWLSILETSFILFRLQPWYRNFNKRTVRSPKIYFHDTGLLCHLLGITTPDQLNGHFAYGHLFENFVISELQKQHWNAGKLFPAFFWRDSSGNEIDLLLEHANSVSLMEIKSGQTVREKMFVPMKRFQKMAEPLHCNLHLIHTGIENREQSGVRVQNWRDVEFGE